tara:strand:- start:492 stop:1817 length:1326 start_codon:yes stop_codon:yes gene_type:complete
MAQLTGGSFKRISPEDIKVRRSALNQLVDVIQEDVSGSTTRRAYQVFVTGGVGPGVTSSLYQTVYDQDFTLQTANPIFDMTVGLYESGSTVTQTSTGIDSAGKLLFPSQSLMMREKVDIYKQYAKVLLGDAESSFSSPFGDASDSNRIDEALFVSFKRLFARDKIKKETFAMRFYETGSMTMHETNGFSDRETLAETSTSGSMIFTDIGAATNTQRTFGGDVAAIVSATDTSRKVGLLFYDHGTCVFDISKIISGTQHVYGTIDAMNAGTGKSGKPVGTMMIGGGIGNFASSGGSFSNTDNNGSTDGAPVSKSRFRAKYVPDLMVSASIDQILDHFATCRFQSGTLTAMTFQNVTTINSTLIFCRATADEFNYSTNPTFTNASGRIRVVDQGQEDTQRSFTFPTTVGLHDEFGNLLAVAKLSRPIEKNDERDVTFRVRLDF